MTKMELIYSFKSTARLLQIFRISGSSLCPTIKSSSMLSSKRSMKACKRSSALRDGASTLTYSSTRKLLRLGTTRSVMISVSRTSNRPPWTQMSGSKKPASTRQRSMMSTSWSNQHTTRQSFSSLVSSLCSRSTGAISNLISTSWSTKDCLTQLKRCKTP